MPPILSIVGRSRSGKTTLIEKLIPELKQRGYRIGTIKHALHDFEFDKTGKDSWRHHVAGADTVVLASQAKIAMVRNTDGDDLQALLSYFSDLDLIVTEGFKREKQPKIEVLRAARHTQLVCHDDPHLAAVVTDVDVDLDVPKFGLEEISDLADFIEKRFLNPRQPVLRVSKNPK